MGDRVIIQLKSGNEYSPALYLHWGGESAPELLEEFYEKFITDRGDDLQYGFARLVGYACALAGADNTTGVGVWNSEEEVTESQGDAGIFIVDIVAKTVQHRDGYKPTIPLDSKWTYESDASGEEEELD